MSTPLNYCHLAPGSVMAFRVRPPQFYYNPTLLSAVRAPGLGASSGIFVFLKARGKVCYEKEVAGSGELRTEL